MSSNPPSPLADPGEALARMLDRLQPVAAETIDLASATDRVLAEPGRSDRPSPPSDVSAMDGYAVRLADLDPDGAPQRLTVASEVAIGRSPPTLPSSQGAAVRIFTGGAVPNGADAVIKREDVGESPEAIDLPEGLIVKPGSNIRRRGENLSAGKVVVPAGTTITAGVVAALASFGITMPAVYRPVRVALIVTGDELLPPDAEPTPWQWRDANGPQLRALLGQAPWITLHPPVHAADRLANVTSALREALDHSDAVLLTGGVSMGDHDHVPAAVRQAGGEILFHKLAQRPGKPALGAVGPAGQAILGLPGNPGSVLTTARRLGVAVLRRLAGCRQPEPPPPAVTLTNPGEKRLDLWWSRPVRLTQQGEATIVATMGSGDFVSIARSDGFVTLPPGEHGRGPWPFYTWSIG